MDGLFDDLLPASVSSQLNGLFDDLIPKEDQPPLPSRKPADDFSQMPTAEVEGGGVAPLPGNRGLPQSAPAPSPAPDQLAGLFDDLIPVQYPDAETIAQGFDIHTPDDPPPKLPDPNRPESSYGEILSKAVTQFPERSKYVLGGALQAVGEHLPINGADKIAKYGSEMAHEAKKYLQENASNVDQYTTKGFVSAFSTSFIDNAPATLTGLGFARVGAAGAAAFLMSVGSVFNQQYAESRDTGRSPNEALQDAAAYAGAEAIPEYLKFRELFRLGSGFARRVIGTASVEGLEEAVTQAIQNLYSMEYLGKKMTLWEYVRDIFYYAGLGVANGGVTGGVVHPLIHQSQTDAGSSQTEADAPTFSGGTFEAKPPGPIQAPPANVTSSDIASPIPTDLISEGKAIAGAALAPSAPLPAPENLPEMGSRVTLTAPDGQQIEGTVADLYRDPRPNQQSVPGIELVLDDGRSVMAPLDRFSLPAPTPAQTIQENQQVAAGPSQAALQATERAAEALAATPEATHPQAEAQAPAPVSAPPLRDMVTQQDMQPSAAIRPPQDAMSPNVGVAGTQTATDISAPMPAATVTLSASGKPFATEKSAMAAAKKRPDMVPVQVEGGWGLTQRQPSASVPVVEGKRIGAKMLSDGSGPSVIPEQTPVAAGMNAPAKKKAAKTAPKPQSLFQVRPTDQDAGRPKIDPTRAIPVVQVTPRFNGSRKEALLWARQNLQGRMLTNRETGWTDILVGRSAIDKAVNDNKKTGTLRTPAELDALTELPKLMDSAVLVESNPHRDGGDMTYHRLYAAINLGGTLYRAKLTVKENADGRRYWDVQATELEPMAGATTSGAKKGEEPGSTGLVPALLGSDAVATPSSQNPDTSRRAESGRSDIDLATLLADVKREDGTPVLSREAFERDLSNRLKSLGLSDKVRLNFVNRLTAMVNGTLTEADGLYFSRVIEVALDSKDGITTLNHEAIHALRDLGLFKPAEWTTLIRAVLADTKQMADIRERYSGLSENALVEEAIAERFAKWAEGRESERGFIRTAFESVRSFLQSLGNALRGHGFTSVDSILQRVDRGEVGARKGEFSPRDIPPGRDTGASAVNKYALRDENDFVKSHDGSYVFGHIAIDGKPIKMKVGTPEDYGASHLEIGKGKRIRNAGFIDVEDYVDFVSKNYSQIYGQENGRLLLVVDPGRHLNNNRNIDNVMSVELKDFGSYYGVTTAIPDAGKSYKTNSGRRLLWDRGSVPAATGSEYQPPVHTTAEQVPISDRLGKLGQSNDQNITTPASDVQAKYRIRGNPRQESAIHKAIDIDERSWVQRVKDAVTSAVGRFNQEKTFGIADKFHGIKRLERSLINGEVVDRDLPAYVAARLTLHTAGQIESVLKHGRPMWNAAEQIMEIQPDTKGLFEIVSPLYQKGLDRLFEGYAYARRVDTQGLLTPDHKGNIREQNLNEGDVKSLLELEKQYPEFRAIFDEIQHWKRGFLDVAEAMGLVNAQQRQTWEQLDHVPFYRVTEDEKVKGPNSGRGLANQTAGIRRLTGGPERFLVTDTTTGEVISRHEDRQDAQVAANKLNLKQRDRYTVEKGGVPIPGIIENIVQNSAHLLQASMKNHAAHEVIAVALQAGEAEKVPMAMQRALIPTDQIVKRLESVGVDMARVESEALRGRLKEKGVLVPAQISASDLRDLGREHGIDPEKAVFDEIETLWSIIPPKDKDVVQVRVDGKPQYYRVKDRMLLSSLIALHQQSEFGSIVKVLSTFRNILTRTITVDPGFMMRNWQRDTVSAWTLVDTRNAGLGSEMLRSASATFKSLRSTSASHVALMAAGGDTGYYQNAPANITKQLSHLLLNKTIGILSFSRAPGRALEMWEAVGRASEMANRIATYEATLAETGSKRKAAFEAADLLDFQLHGAWTSVQQATAVIPFLNARIQGLYRMGKSMSQTQLRHALLMRGGLLASMALALALINAGDDDEGGYNDLPEYLKDTYYVVPFQRVMGWVIGSDRAKQIVREAGLPRFICLPKPFEVGVLFGTGIERMVQSLAGNDRGKDTFEAVKRAFLTTFAFDPTSNPITGELIAQYANKDSFTGRPIVPRAQEGLLPEAQWDKNTSETAKLVGQITGMSPQRLEHALGAFTAAIGMYTLGVTDAFLHGVGATSGPAKPERRLDEMPIIRSFIRQDPLRNTKWEERFYTLLHEADQIVKTANHYRDIGMGKESKELRTNEPWAMGGVNDKGRDQINPVLHNIDIQMTEIRKQIKAVENNPRMDASEKRDRIDGLIERRNRISRRAGAFEERWGK